jgi:hypothetical protein
MPVEANKHKQRDKSALNDSRINQAGSIIRADYALSILKPAPQRPYPELACG